MYELQAVFNDFNLTSQQLSPKAIPCQKYRVSQNDCRGHTQYTPDATPCDFFLWGYVKDQLYVPPLPTSIPELNVRI